MCRGGCGLGVDGTRGGSSPGRWQILNAVESGYVSENWRKKTTPRTVGRVCFSAGEERVQVCLL